jgi:hypothetical protein
MPAEWQHAAAFLMTHLKDVRLVDVRGVSKRVGAAVDQQLAVPRRIEESLQANRFIVH